MRATLTAIIAIDVLILLYQAFGRHHRGRGHQFSVMSTLIATLGRMPPLWQLLTDDCTGVRTWPSLVFHSRNK